MTRYDADPALLALAALLLAFGLLLVAFGALVVWGALTP